MLEAGGASWESLTSLTRIFFSPVVVSTYQSSPCSPELSRSTKDTLLPSGLHLMVSGARPVRPPSAKMASMVSCFAGAAVWALPAENNNMVSSKAIKSLCTNALRFSVVGTSISGETPKVYKLGGLGVRIANERGGLTGRDQTDSRPN